MNKTEVIKNVTFTMLAGLTLLGMFFTANSRNQVDFNRPAQAGTTPVYSTLAPINLVKADFGLTTTNNTAFTVVKGTGNETFTYTGTTDQTATGATNPWFTLKSTASQRFTQSTESGSVANKWHLTSITIVYSKATATIGQTNIVKLNTFDLFTYTSVTNSTSLTNLNANQMSSTTSFNYSDNITTFTIIPTYIVYISSISLTYTIDYGSC